MFDPVIRGLLRRAGMEPPQWHDEELSHAFPGQRDLILSSGLIGPTEPTTFAECPHCGPGTMGRVHPIQDRRTGRISFRLPCRTCGLVEVPADALRLWQLDVAAFAAAVARAVGARGEPDPFADGRGWFLGRGAWAKRSHEAFLLRAVHAAKVPLLRDRLARHPKAVVFAATPEDAAAWRPHGTQTLVPLGEVLAFDGELRGDTAAVEAAVAAPASAVSRRPVGRKSPLLARIDRLKQELVAHIRAARKYAFDQRERTGEPRLLERPSKSKLGELAGLKPYEVTRCFDDDAGRELVLLWEVADDLDQILRYGG
jgi:hypothetical protein